VNLSSENQKFQRFKYEKNCAVSTVVFVFETLKISIFKGGNAILSKNEAGCV